MNNTPQSLASQEENRSVELKPDPSREPWQERGEEHRREEWEMSRKLLTASRLLLRRYLATSDAKPSLADVTRMLELASKLGRLATGLATEKTEISGQGGGPLRVEFRAMLDKVYGQPLPGELPLLNPPAPSVDLNPNPTLNLNPPNPTPNPAPSSP